MSAEDLYDPDALRMDDLRAAIGAGVDRAYGVDRPWIINTSKRKPRLVEAILLRLIPVISARQGEVVSDIARRMALQADARAELEHAAGYRQGHQAALVEAAAMLKRHGHRSAVTRLLALADEAVQTPARPRPVNASPAGGPGLSAPDSGEVAPEPTGPENGAQRGVQGLQGAIDAASDAERERRERDAWVGHAPTSPRPRTYAARLAAAGDEAPDD